MDDALSVFTAERPRLFGIAYRMLGCAVEAEDVVQDAWLRWQRVDRGDIRDAAAFLTIVTTRLSINVAQSARSRRQAYIGPWLPEPVDTSADPRLGAERGDALEFAVLRLLEALTPAERAAYVLREAFDYPYRQIAEILQLSEANARQLVTRARKHIAEGRRAPVHAAEQRRLLEAFMTAAQHGDVAGLEALFAEDICSYSDGNGMPNVARKPLLGRSRVAKFVSLVRSRLWIGTTVEVVEANGQACFLVRRAGAAYALGTVHGSDHGIDSVMWVMSPAKLSRISRQDGGL
jgi:RNA polymerase sigma-70 factor (ECF subfamily)